MALKIGSNAILLCDITDAPNYTIANIKRINRPLALALFQRGRRVILSAEPVNGMVRISSPDNMTVSAYIGLESLKPARGRPRIFDFRT
jgi:hypothetical protein